MSAIIICLQFWAISLSCQSAVHIIFGGNFGGQFLKSIELTSRLSRHSPCLWRKWSTQRSRSAGPTSMLATTRGPSSTTSTLLTSAKIVLHKRGTNSGTMFDQTQILADKEIWLPTTFLTKKLPNSWNSYRMKVPPKSYLIVVVSSKLLQKYFSKKAEKN